MEVQRVQEQHPGSLLDGRLEPARPVRRTIKEPRYHLLVEARRRRILANLMVVSSSVLMLAAAFICYLLLE